MSLTPYVIPGVGEYDLRGSQCHVEVIERDEYGRIMFKFYNEMPTYSEFCGTALIICQKTTRVNIYYYVKECCIISNEKFNDTEIEELKYKNDWNLPIDKSKLTKISCSQWPYIELEGSEKLGEERLIKAILSNALDVTNEQVVMFFADDVDSGNNVMYCMAILNNDGTIENYFAIMNEDYKPVFMKYDNLSEYQDELILFKSENGWKHLRKNEIIMPYCNIIGKIVFTEKLEEDDAVKLSYYLTQKAIDNRIGIKTI